MLSGDNGILQRATDAKTRTEKAQIIENAQTDILGQQTENKGANITKGQLAEILNTYFKPTETTAIPDEVSSELGHDLELTTIDEKYKIYLSEIFIGNFPSLVTFGERYTDSMIGKSIDYKSEKNNINDWIIIGKQTNAQGKNDVIITTKNPEGSQISPASLTEWVGYEENLNNSCKTYVGETGTLGTKAAMVQEVRSIKMEDINYSVGFNETINSITISNDNGGDAYPNSNGTGWVVNTDSEYSSYTFPTESYGYGCISGVYSFGSVTNNFANVPIELEKQDNLKYILSSNELYNDVPYLVASRSVGTAMGRAYFRVFGVTDYGPNFLNVCVSNPRRRRKLGVWFYNGSSTCCSFVI